MKKTWQQISSGNFLNSVNPKDIAFIAEAEAWFKLESKRLSVSEETRKGTVTLVNGGERLKIKSCELLSAYETLERVSSVDVSMIAYREGFIKGREVSSLLSEKENIKSRPKAVLRIIK